MESGFALWLNGHYVGYSEDTFDPSAFELTAYIIEGENKLAVRVWTVSYTHLDVYKRQAHSLPHGPGSFMYLSEAGVALSLIHI